MSRDSNTPSPEPPTLANAPPTPVEASPTRKNPGAAFTPANTPATATFPKVPKNVEGSGSGNNGAQKRTLEASKAEGHDINEMLSKLAVGGTKGRSNAAKDEEEDEDEDEEEGEDEDDDDDQDDEEIVEMEWTADDATRERLVPNLRENRSNMAQVMHAYTQERFELELKYQELLKPVYDARAELVRGGAPQTIDSNTPKALPGFWRDVIEHSQLASRFVEEWDTDALLYLDDVRCELIKPAIVPPPTTEDVDEDYDENNDERYGGFELSFYFSENPYFTNRVLKKRIIVPNLLQQGASLEITSSKGTEIIWNEGKNLTVKIETIKVQGGGRGGGKRGSGRRGGGGGRTQVIKKEVPQPSFFGFFKTRQELDEIELDAMPHDAQVEYHQAWSYDFMLGDFFRCRLIPEALAFYLGEAEESEFGDDDYEDEDEEGEEEGEEGEEEEDEDEDEEEHHSGKHNNKRGGGGGDGRKKKQGSSASPPKVSQSSGAGSGDGNGGQQPECKNQ